MFETIRITHSKRLPLKGNLRARIINHVLAAMKLLEKPFSLHEVTREATEISLQHSLELNLAENLPFLML